MAVCLYPEQLVNIFIHWPVIYFVYFDKFPPKGCTNSYLRS